MTRWLRRRKRGAKFLNPSSLILPLSIIIKPSLLIKSLGLKSLFDGAFREAVKSQQWLVLYYKKRTNSHCLSLVLLVILWWN